MASLEKEEKEKRRPSPLLSPRDKARSQLPPVSSTGSSSSQRPDSRLGSADRRERRSSDRSRSPRFTADTRDQRRDRDRERERERNKHPPPSPFVCKVTGEPLKTFCHDCKVLECLVCPSQTHKGHNVQLLRDFSAKAKCDLKPLHDRTSLLLNELKRLEEETPTRAANLHSQVDEAVDNLIMALNKRRKTLHEDIKNRSNILLTQLSSELQSRKEQLQQLESAKLVLALLSSGRGVAPEGPIGDILRGIANYDEFLEVGDPPLTPSPSIKQLLQVGLPYKMREEVHHFGWSAGTLHAKPLVYPPKGF